MTRPTTVELHVCLPGILPMAFARVAAADRAGLAARGVRVVESAAAVDASVHPIERSRTVIVDPIAWSPRWLRRWAPPAGCVASVVVWRPSALELVARLAQHPDPAARTAALVASAAETHGRLSAVAADRFTRVEHRAVADEGGEVFVAAARALGATPIDRMPAIAGPLADADGRVDLDALASLIVRGWRAACPVGGQP
ncbi:MAG: hypothetical protein R3F65_12530 [bacterium]